MLNGLEVEFGDGKTPIFNARHFPGHGIRDRRMEAMVADIAVFLGEVAAAEPRRSTPVGETYGWAHTQYQEPPPGDLAVVNDWNIVSARCRSNLHDFVTIGRRAIPTVLAWYEWGDDSLVPDELSVL